MIQAFRNNDQTNGMKEKMKNQMIKNRRIDKEINEERDLIPSLIEEKMIFTD